MILLSFDIEEFDMPLEYKGIISLEEQLAISREGTKKILELLRKHQAKATFFSTVVFAENNKDLIRQIIDEGHELASHTWFHSQFSTEHLEASRKKLEELAGVSIKGLRMPRMSPVKKSAVAEAGYKYNSSINPTFLPGRYNNLNISRTHFLQDGVLQIPASVSPFLRIPLFWLSFHNFPLFFYKYLISRTYARDKYINIYFHPWEFVDISSSQLKIPFYARKNTGDKMIKRFDAFMNWIQKKDYQYGCLQELFEQQNQRRASL